MSRTLIALLLVGCVVSMLCGRGAAAQEGGGQQPAAAAPSPEPSAKPSTQNQPQLPDTPAGKVMKQVLDAYSSRDGAPALAIWFQDEDIDAHYNSLFRELLTYMMEDPRTIGPCAHLLFVAKNIERIGDHCTNIAENVHDLVTGDPIATSRPKADESDRTTDY